MDKSSILAKLGEDPLTSSWWPWLIAAIVGLVTCIKTYMGGAECPSVARVDGKVAVVTGANGGVGLHIATELARRGARVVLACRDVAAGETAAASVRAAARGAEVSVGQLDLCSFASIRAFVDKLDCARVDILVNNAGVVFHPEGRTEDGFEIHLQTNYLGPFLLSHLLLPRLVDGRIVNTSAVAHFAGDVCLSNLNMQGCFSAREAFMQSKLAVVMATREMAARLHGSGVTVNCLHPGMVRGTGHMRHSPFSSSLVLKVPMLPWIWLLTKSPLQGAQTAIFLCVEPALSSVSGKYFADCEEKSPAEKVNDAALVNDLYQKTCELVGVAPAGTNK